MLMLANDAENNSITMEQTSKWQTHLPYLLLETLRVHNSISGNCKPQTINDLHTDVILGNRTTVSDKNSWDT